MSYLGGWRGVVALRARITMFSRLTMISPGQVIRNGPYS
jgi:hypothetical protein